LRASWIASEEDAPALSRKEFSRDLLPASVPFEISSGLGGWTVRGDAEFGLALSILSIMEEAWLTRSFVEERRRFSRVRDDADDVLGTVPVSSSIEGGVGEGWAEGGGVIHDAREHDGGSNEISIGGSGENVGERHDDESFRLRRDPNGRVPSLSTPTRAQREIGVVRRLTYCS
jgi:hypothetical protein